MDIKLSLKTSILKSLESLGKSFLEDDIVIELSKDKTHGDYASNVALKLSRFFNLKPIELATKILENFKNDEVEKVEIAGPGFINFFMKSSSLQSIIKKIIDLGKNYGNGTNKKEKVNVEFVSANPTGPLHIGHARGAAYGDSLVNILKKYGYQTTREYYINDAGNQINNLAKSIYLRYKELFGQHIELDDDCYHGEDIISIAKEMKSHYNDTLLDDPQALEIFKNEGMKKQLDKIKEDLAFFGIKFDIFSSEIAIRSNGAIEKELENLKPYIYKENGGTLLKTTAFLDDKDRPIVKSNGDYTYFLPDIVYHLNKLSRGYDSLIDVLGADHHGYVARMKSALMMHGYKKECLEVSLIQMVRIFKDGQEIKLSKRTGQTLTLRELCDEVGVDAVRYFMVARDINSHLDFSLDLARQQSSSNPVYYAQYAYARLINVLEAGKDIELDTSGSLCTSSFENRLMKLLSIYPDTIKEAALNREPFVIANYVQKLSALVHSFYTECRVLDRNDLSTTSSRLALCKACSIVIEDALSLIGVSAPNKM